MFRFFFVRKIYYFLLFAIPIFGKPLNIDELCSYQNGMYFSKALKNDCKRLSDLKVISKALDKSFRIHFNYTQPEKIHIDWSIEKGKNWSSESDLKQLEKEGLLKYLPVDPINNKEYFYFYEPLNNLYLPFYQLCASKLETTKKPYCIQPKIYKFYSDHLFVKADIILDKKKIRVVSANILYGGSAPYAPKIISTLKEQVALLKKIKPDIIGFQEVEVDTARALSRNSFLMNRNEISFFSKNLKLKYYKWDMYKKLLIGSSGKLTLSRYKIIFSKKINKHLNICGIDIDANNKTDLLITNMHIKLDKGKVHPTIIKKIIDNSIEKMLKTFPKLPIVLVGDFRFNNLNLENYGFKDTYEICSEEKNPKLKYKNTYVSTKSRRVDYIFIRKLKCKKKSHTILIPPLKN